MERDQRIDIAFSGDGLIEHNGAGREDDSGNVTPDIKNGGQKQKKQSHEFQGVAQLKTGLGVVSHGDEGHV